MLQERQQKGEVMSEIEKYDGHKGYESLSRSFLQDNTLSLGARGLLAYMVSMPDNYVFYKTQLYQCFQKNKKSSVQNFWTELIEAGYILEFKKRSGKKWANKYLFAQEKFDEKDQKILAEKFKSEGYFWGAENQNLNKADNRKDFWGADFGKPKMGSSKPAVKRFINQRFTNQKDDDDKKAAQKIFDAYQIYARQENILIDEINDLVKIKSLIAQYGAVRVNEAMSRAIKKYANNPFVYVQPMLQSWVKSKLETLEAITQADPFIPKDVKYDAVPFFHIPTNGPWNQTK